MSYVAGSSNTGYYSIATGAAINIPSTDFCYGLRFYYSSTPSNDNLFDAHTNSPSEGWRMWIDSSNHIFTSLDLNPTSYQNAAGTVAMTSGHWVMVACRDNSASTLYVKACKFGASALHDSASKTSLTANNKGAWTSVSPHIGADKDLSSSQYMVNGRMAEAFKIDGTILSDESIIALANGAPIDSIPESNGLVGWWDFRSAETTVYNKAGSTCNATKQNTLTTGEHYPITSAQVIKFPSVGGGSFVPYPNPRYGMTGGMQNQTGGMQ